MLRRTIPLLRRLLRHDASLPSPPLILGAATGLRPHRGLCSWSPAASAPCPKCGLVSALNGPCSLCGFHVPKAPQASSHISTPMASASSPSVQQAFASASSPSVQQAFASAAPTAAISPHGVLIPNQQRKVVLSTGKACYHLLYKNPLDHFKEKPMLVKVTDPNEGIHMLLTPNPKRPWLLTEGGKFSMKSLKDLVVQAHREGWTLGKEQLSLENLIVSSIGTFKFKIELIQYELNDNNQIEDFLALSDVMLALLKMLYGDDIINFLPDDFMMMIANLRTISNPKLATFWIDVHPALLPLACYGPAYLKFHGLFMEADRGLLYTHRTDAMAVLRGLSYRTAGDFENDWTIMANNDPWLDFWFSFSDIRYMVKNERQAIIFPRHVVAHCLNHRGWIPINLSPTGKARLLGGPCSQSIVMPFYQPEAIYVLLQYKFPRWLPQIMRGVVELCDRKNMMGLFHNLRFEQFFHGASGCFVK